MSVDSKMTAIADAIRAKTGGTSVLTLDQMATEIGEIGGVDLPELTNEGAASDLMKGKQLISGSGAVVSGSFTLDSEISEQDALIEQIKTALKGKAAGGGSTETDPRDEYQRVESITSDGSSYVVTDFIADNSCGLELVASFPTLVDRPPMGSRADTGSTRFYCVYPLSANSCYYGFNGGSTLSCALTVDAVYRLQTNFLNSRLVNIIDADGNRKGGASISESLSDQNVPVSIFGYNHGGTNTINSKRSFTLYSARTSKGNDVSREYIPCYRKSDGVIGLLEKFTGTFLTTPVGAFTKGADIDW